MSNTERERYQREYGPSRRAILRALAASGVAVGLSPIALAQDEPIELGGDTPGWQGRAPAEIEGEVNPTLEFEAGQTYTVEWENVDGLPHNFAILDGAGSQLVRSEVIEGEGETQTVEFEATAEMAEYYCEVHPDTMRGDVEVAGEAAGGDELEDDTPVSGEIPDGPSIGLQRVAEGIPAPTGMEIAEGVDDRRYVVVQTGQIFVHTDEGGLQEEPFLDIEDRLVDLGLEDLGGYDERGLLGLAFHPDFESNDRFFVRYSAASREGTPEEFDHTDVLAEFAADSPDAADPDSERVLLEIPMPQDNHNGGALAFGPDGYLYSSVGDGGNVHDIGTGHVEDWYEENEGGNAQDTTENLLGGVHRLDVDDGGATGEIDEPEMESTDEENASAENASDEVGQDEDVRDDENGVEGNNETSDVTGNETDTNATSGNETDINATSGNETDADGMETDGTGDAAYGIPEDNPLVGEEGDHRGEYYAWGFRNPWRMSFDSDGRLFVGDAGQHRYEEVSLVEAGGNYGWNVKEGTHCFSPAEPLEPIEECPDETPEDVRGGEPLRDPIVEFRHRRLTEAFIDSSVVVGGYVYEGDAIGDLEGSYVFGNWSGEGVVDRDGEIFVATEPSAGEGGGEDTELEGDDAAGNETAATGNETVTDGNETSTDGNETAAQGNETESGGEDATVSVHSLPEYGDVLVGPDGMTLYMFEQDTQGDDASACYDDCADSWPPLTVDDEPTASEEVTAELTTFEREDGQTQVAAAGWPLYYFEPDEEPGDANGQGANDVWWVLGADGTPVRSAAGDEESDAETDDEAAGEDDATDAELWDLEEAVVDGSENGRLNRYVYAFGRDHDDELYVLTNTEYTPDDETGEVFKIVPPEEGESIEMPPAADEDGAADGNETADNETSDD
ncbi:PQQ-dependent sugar dehydrogenase [Halomontanus rarus]|uniref:PQQ-dependent sugar dehydrogenase n=1 Tax=Halomontanus rarus TaxID=3034020 RepID=UPI0023E7CD01|nr:PQQ-dependent sugar dehydrogenase [Halovivax sp. TS33]